MLKTIRPMVGTPGGGPASPRSNLKLEKLRAARNKERFLGSIFHLGGFKAAAERDDIKDKILNNNLGNGGGGIAGGVKNNNKGPGLRKSAAAWFKSASAGMVGGSPGGSSGASAATAQNTVPASATTMDLLQLLAINALEFTAPASAAFFVGPNNKEVSSGASDATSTVTTTGNNNKLNGNLNVTKVSDSSSISSDVTSTTSSVDEEGHQAVHHRIRRSFVQLSGHPGCFAPAGPNTLWKRQADGSCEADVYDHLSSSEDPMRKVIPSYHSRTEWNGETFLEIEDLLTAFDTDAAVMDLKIGQRTFMESEVKNTTAREDLYKKMVKVDPDAPTKEEHEAKAVTKLRYMQFREEQSSTSSLGFRIEAIKFRNTSEPVSDLKTMKTEAEVRDTMCRFLPTDKDVRAQLLTRLSEIRVALEASDFFMTHEVIGSSVLLIHDSHKAGAWLIDFAKTVPSAAGRLSHRKNWEMGNHEDGYLSGMDNLIRVLQEC